MAPSLGELFFGLSPELRDIIYGFVFERPPQFPDDPPDPEHNPPYCDIIEIYGKGKVQLPSSNREVPGSHKVVKWIDNDGKPADAAALIRVSKAIYREALPVLYDSSLFVVRIAGDIVDPNDDHLDCFQLGTINTLPLFKHIRHVKLEVTLHQMPDMRRLMTNIEAFIAASKTNPKLDISEIEIKYSIETGPDIVDPILQALSDLPHRKSGKVKVWLKPIWLRPYTGDTSTVSQDELQAMLQAIGGVDCSTERDAIEVKLNERGRRSCKRVNMRLEKVPPRIRPAWDLFERPYWYGERIGDVKHFLMRDW